MAQVLCEVLSEALSRLMLPDAQEALCRRHPVKAVYLTPLHQFPAALMASAERYDFHIIEDDYDHELHFDHRPMQPLGRPARGVRRFAVQGAGAGVESGLRRPGGPEPCVDRWPVSTREGSYLD
ncbi:hypothetical protein BKX93_14225 [Chromobacterium vaccinii]|uniref:Uncharacterized protein n=1 Tax=Chromobacterium vaccinii TaxID=1108595 RepID=A0A1D9LIE7_9NEIS|nr:hypothetical protein BKX93_14225 [Chromobacterium vaccinii]